jgi:hypothetical protein
VLDASEEKMNKKNDRRDEGVRPELGQMRRWGPEDRRGFPRTYEGPPFAVSFEFEDGSSIVRVVGAGTAREAVKLALRKVDSFAEPVTIRVSRGIVPLDSRKTTD